MAFFDFLGQPVGGYNDTALDTGGMEFSGGSATMQSPKNNITWGQLLGAIARMSNSGSGQGLGQLMGNQFGMAGQGVQGFQPYNAKQPEIYRIGPTSDYNRPEQKDSSSIGEIAAIASAFIGV